MLSRGDRLPTPKALDLDMDFQNPEKIQVLCLEDNAKAPRLTHYPLSSSIKTPAYNNSTMHFLLDE